MGKETPVSNRWEYKSKDVFGTRAWRGDKLISAHPLESFIPNSYIVSSTGLASHQYSNWFGV